MIAKSGESCAIVPNGVDFEEFGVDRPIEERRDKLVLFIAYDLEFKGTSDAIEAVIAAKSRVPDMKAAAFGICIRPQTLPDWIPYYQNPTTTQIRQLYNSASVFIGSSWSEGFGLTGCEAALCGAALCMADNGGHREYSFHDSTALLHPPRRPEVLAANIVSLLDDDARRTTMAGRARELVLRYSWGSSVSALEEFLRAGSKI